MPPQAGGVRHVHALRPFLKKTPVATEQYHARAAAWPGSTVKANVLATRNARVLAAAELQINILQSIRATQASSTCLLKFGCDG